VLEAKAAWGGITRSSIGAIALIVGLLVLPLYPKIALVAIQGTYIPVRIDDLVSIAILAAWAVVLVRERRRPRVPPVGLPVLVWLALGLLAVVLGAAFLGTIGWGTGLLFWAKPIEYLLLGWAAYDLLDSRARWRAALWVVFITAAIVVGYALLERFQIVPPAPNYASDVTARRGALGSTMGDQHQMASYLGIIVLTGVALWHRARRNLRIAALVALVATAYVLQHAAARSEFIALGVGLVLLLAWRPARIPAAVMLLSMAAMLVLPASAERALDQAFGVTQQNPPGSIDGSGANGQSGLGGSVSVAGRIAGLGDDRSLTIRLRERWPVFIAKAMRDPIFGVGPSAATEAADGYYIRSFVEVGIAGTIAFAAMILAVVLALRRVVRESAGGPKALAVGLIVATLFVALVSVLIDTWVASRVMQLYWPLVGAALATRWWATRSSGGSEAVAPSTDAGPGSPSRPGS
jgi:hypothetical protein